MQLPDRSLDEVRRRTAAPWDRDGWPGALAAGRDWDRNVVQAKGRLGLGLGGIPQLALRVCVDSEDLKLASPCPALFLYDPPPALLHSRRCAPAHLRGCVQAALDGPGCATRLPHPSAQARGPRRVQAIVPQTLPRVHAPRIAVGGPGEFSRRPRKRDSVVAFVGLESRGVGDGLRGVGVIIKLEVR